MILTPENEPDAFCPDCGTLLDRDVISDGEGHDYLQVTCAHCD